MRNKLLLLTALLMVSLTACSEKPKTEPTPPNNTNEDTSTSSKQPEEETSQDSTTSDENSNDELQDLLINPIQTEISGWKIDLESCIISSELKNISTVLGYAATETNEFSKAATEGSEFVILKMKFEKNSSKDVIDWKKLELVDSNQNSYSRIEDSFLEELGLKRMSGTTLNFGTNEGWIAFEVKQGYESLSLQYPFTSETYNQPIELKQ